MTAETTALTNQAVKLVAPTVSSLTASTGSSSSNTECNKKVVLFNPNIDYSAPLPQQINPDLIGAHPHAQQYINSYNAIATNVTTTNNNCNNNNNNQVRQQTRNQQPQAVAAAFVTNAAANLLSSPSPSSTSMLIPQQIQQQKKRSILPSANLPINLSNNFTNQNLNNNLTIDMNAHKLIQQQQLQQQQQQVGFFVNNKLEDSDLSVNRALGSSISNLFISNNVTPTKMTTSTGALNNNNNNKLNALRNQQHQQQQDLDTISALWGCSSNASFTSSGCSSGSNSSQPSLSPTSNCSRQEFPRNGKDSLWSLTQTNNSNNNNNNNTINDNINNLRDNYYMNNNAKIAESPTTSLASSTKSISSDMNGMWSLNYCNNGSDNPFFAANVNSPSPATNEVATHFSKMSNIWEMPTHPDLSHNETQSNTRSNNHLFSDLWNTNKNNDNAHANANECANKSQSADFDTAQIWRNSSAVPIAKCLTMPTSNAAMMASTPKQQQASNMDTGDGGASANASDSNTCMQLFSEDFLNYLNTLN